MRTPEQRRIDRGICAQIYQNGGGVTALAEGEFRPTQIYHYRDEHAKVAALSITLERSANGNPIQVYERCPAIKFILTSGKQLSTLARKKDCSMSQCQLKVII